MGGLRKIKLSNLIWKYIFDIIKKIFQSMYKVFEEKNLFLFLIIKKSTLASNILFRYFTNNKFYKS